VRPIARPCPPHPRLRLLPRPAAHPPAARRCPDHRHRLPGPSRLLCRRRPALRASPRLAPPRRPSPLVNQQRPQLPSNQLRLQPRRSRLPGPNSRCRNPRQARDALRRPVATRVVRVIIWGGHIPGEQDAGGGHAGTVARGEADTSQHPDAGRWAEQELPALDGARLPACLVLWCTEVPVIDPAGDVSGRPRRAESSPHLAGPERHLVQMGGVAGQRLAVRPRLGELRTSQRRRVSEASLTASYKRVS